MTKKVAVCISGQTRSFREGYVYLLKNLLSLHNCDVFIHTWNGPDVGDVIKLYNPKISMIEGVSPLTKTTRYTRVPPPSPGWNIKNPAYATYCQLRSIYFANKMRGIYQGSNDYYYDWVVRTRFDFALNAQIPFDKLNPNKLYVPNCRMTPAHDFCNDQLAFGSMDVMSAYSSTFEHIDMFYDQGVVMIGEDMLSANLKLRGLVGSRLVYCDMNHPFPPGEHNGTPHSLIRKDVDKWRP